MNIEIDASFSEFEEKYIPKKIRDLIIVKLGERCKSAIMETERDIDYLLLLSGLSAEEIAKEKQRDGEKKKENYN